ncbi:MAG: GAF domain-containing protein [Deltaproteobacteria bacterium]|nr:GAF domain-containing protein [Deltaproteobacteria bacterium]
MPARERAGEPAAATVEAENWKSALAAALRQLDEPHDGVAKYSCDVREDGSLQIVDLGSRRVFLLRDLEYVAAAPITPPPEAVARRASMLPSSPSVPARASAPPVASRVPAAPRASAGPAPRPSAAPVAPAAAPAPAVLPEHQLFFSRDEEPSSGSSLWYRERLISVPPGTTREGINLLLMSYYNALRAEAANRNEAKYINVAVFDHVFTSRAERPALGALNWKSWRSEVPEVSYPVDQPSLPLPQMTPPAAAAAPAPSAPTPARAPSTPPPPVVQQSLPATGSAAAPVPGSREPSYPGTTRNPLAQTGRRRVPTPADLARIGREGHEEMVVNEILAQVFEEMMGLFNCRTRESAAEFALDVAMRRIPCEAGSVLLSDINSRDLVFTAVRGDAGHRLKGRRVPMGQGIVGFAAREGVAIAIADVHKDNRWNEGVDRETGFSTRSVIVAPVVHEGLTYGAFELLNRKGAEVFLQTETSIISYIASQLAGHFATSVPFGGELVLDDDRPARPAAPRPGAQRMTKKNAPVIPRTAQVANPTKGKKR